MIFVPPDPDVVSAVMSSSDLLARAMVKTLGSDASLSARVEVERFVAACATWASLPDPKVVPNRPELVQVALREIARWQPSYAGAAAAWQLTLSAIEIVSNDAPSPRDISR